MGTSECYGPGLAVGDSASEDSSPTQPCGERSHRGSNSSTTDPVPNSVPEGTIEQMPDPQCHPVPVYRMAGVSVLGQITSSAPNVLFGLPAHSHNPVSVPTTSHQSLEFLS